MIMDDNCLQVDPEVRPLVIALRSAGIDTDWSCSGRPGHMTIRPTIEARISALSDWSLLAIQKTTIENVLCECGHRDYWLSLVWKRGTMDTHGGEPVWIIELPGRVDFLALPVAYSSQYQDENDLMPGHAHVG